jgi:hypothetical protein
MAITTDLEEAITSPLYKAGGQLLSPQKVEFRNPQLSNNKVVATGRMELRNLIGKGLAVVGFRELKSRDPAMAGKNVKVPWIYPTAKLFQMQGISMLPWMGSPPPHFTSASLDELFSSVKYR